MTIGVLYARGMSKRAIARQLGVDEKAVRYRLARLAMKARDRRGDQVSTVAPFSEAIAHFMVTAAPSGLNGLALYEWLVAEHGFAGSYKAVQRFVRARYGRPRLRVRRPVETPPGAQPQADWAEYHLQAYPAPSPTATLDFARVWPPVHGSRWRVLQL